MIELSGLKIFIINCYLYLYFSKILNKNINSIEFTFDINVLFTLNDTLVLFYIFLNTNYRLNTSEFVFGRIPSQRHLNTYCYLKKKNSFEDVITYQRF